MKKSVTKVKLTGSKSRGWIIEISDNYNFKDDMPISHEEAEILLELLYKKII